MEVRFDVFYKIAYASWTMKKLNDEEVAYKIHLLK